ncbi:MAG: hypothetical protein KKB31_04455 [Nanoarchaeota archaeon]|nr:hypothetical protein [Nanoarchaeota archaeon]
MKITKFSLIGYIFGIMVIILTTERWWFRFHDVSTFLIYIMGACFIIAFAYIHQVLKNKDEELEEIKKDLMAIETDFNRLLTWKNNLKEPKEL